MFLNLSNIKRPKGFVAIPMGVLILDQAAKDFAMRYGSYAKNYGALFGVNISGALAAAALLAFFLFLASYKPGKKEDFYVPSLFMIAGIISNLIDKVRFGFIIDYINIPGFFVFNLADVAILCGCVILVWRIIEE